MQLFSPIATASRDPWSLISGSDLQTESVTDALCEAPVQYTICNARRIVRELLE
jgi:hypothetical protein